MRKGCLQMKITLLFKLMMLMKLQKELATKGMIIIAGPDDYYWGRSAYLRDPEGNLVEICQGK